MAKSTPVPCSEETCGFWFLKCGTVATYVYRKCRCEPCRAAKSEEARQYRANNKEAIAAKKRRDYEANPEAQRARGKRHYDANRADILEKQRQERVENPELVSERKHAHYLRRRDHILEKQRRYREANPETMIQWREANPDKIAKHQQTRKIKGRNPEVLRAATYRRKARVNDAYVEEVDRNVVFERDNWTCQHCGIKCDPAAVWPAKNFATLDHIIPYAWGVEAGGVHSYANTQLLCAPCNSRKSDRHNN